MQKAVYNTNKLTKDRRLYHAKRVLIVGTGAVGTYVVEHCAKMGLSPDEFDFDRFTLENAAKHSCLVRTPDDTGRNKAVCVSERVQPLLDVGCTSNGIDGDLCLLGPEAFSDYDYVVAALDNFDAKVLLNELIRQLPEERRPIVIMDGTHGEMAQSVILDNKKLCIRCMIDESWMKDSSIRTSCTGPQVRQTGSTGDSVDTSGLASSMAAHLSAEQLRGHAIGAKDVMNCRLTYTAYPNLELSKSWPMRKCNCPGCAILPPAKIEWLHGNVMEVTLKEAMEQISAFLGTTVFEMSVHHLNYRKLLHAGFISDEVCHSCGAPIKVMKHEGRVFLNDLLCDKCSSSGKHPRRVTEFAHHDTIRAFTPDTEDDIAKMTLFELGYPLGAHIYVTKCSIKDSYADDAKMEQTVFAFDEDHTKMHQVQKL